ncbi:serine hydrolase domain-containing protein [Muricauda brasiliensis]|uniref:serine hydrolase domain-containing protein n=1 Tax=Muricauda brasiliensis TaxID=2162892 RepID=UPI000D357062|nr:serine hydrolase domain-containing protein [Muricauda brasiliensis]
MKRILINVALILTISMVWVLTCFFGIVNGWWHAPFTNETDPQSFVEAVEEEIQKEYVGNFAMAIIKNGEVKEEVFYSAGKQVDRNTIFQVASMSKFVSATGVMKLQELGKIDLDTPISQYLTRWQLPPSEFDNEQVTVRRLLSHTAGLTDGLGYSGFETPDAVQTLEASLTKAADADEGKSGETKVGIQPNSSWVYSGGGFTLLQLLVEERSGQSFGAFMKENVFAPLQMTRSTYEWSDSLTDDLCEFYNADGTKAPHFFYTSLAATSLYTSLADLEKLFMLFLKDKKDNSSSPLSQSSLSLMQESHWDMMGEAIYGLGTFLYVDVGNDQYIIGHDGQSNPPINTALRIDPVSGDGIIILETGNPDLATRLASDWVFLKTGKVDTLLFTMLQGKMLNMMGIGVLLITVLVIAIAWWRKRKSN